MRILYSLMPILVQSHGSVELSIDGLRRNRLLKFDYKSIRKVNRVMFDTKACLVTSLVYGRF